MFLSPPFDIVSISRLRSQISTSIIRLSSPRQAMPRKPRKKDHPDRPKVKGGSAAAPSKHDAIEAEPLLSEKMQANLAVGPNGFQSTLTTFLAEHPCGSETVCFIVFVTSELLS